ncbi:hypothetical protein ACIOD1_18540 [Streptomyces sp. NPDC088097]|uniref:hypothetical protein n=1 Tax=Streptomyces sp. NPDC088097 TaxID=3365823 RepID=UPI0037F1F8D1
MTPTTGMPGRTGTIRHPEVSEISDLTEGLLSPSRTAEVRRHIGDCALCADVRSSLEEIRSLLGTLPGPPRMPSSVAGRIDAALAAEALLDSTGSRAAAPASAPAPAAEADVSRETSPTAPARPEVPRPCGPSGHPSGPTGPGRRRARRRIGILAGITGAAACVLGGFLFSALGGGPDRPTGASDSARVASSPQVDGGYTAQGLQGSVKHLLATGAPTNKTMGLDTTSPGLAPSDRQASPEEVPPVPPCVRESTGRADDPLASERGTYRGKDVYLLVLPHPGDPARVDAFLVPTGCVDSPGQSPEQPLLSSTYPRS